jgi:Transposase DDE domain
MIVSDIISVIWYIYPMRGATYFTHPVHEWQRRYEALRASLVERLPARVVAERFGYSVGYVHFLRYQFLHGQVDFSEPVPEGRVQRHRVAGDTRQKIRSWREQRLSAGEIAGLLSDEGIDISVRTVERVLAEEGFPKLPRRTKLKIGLTVKGAEVPVRAETFSMHDASFDCEGAGVFLFAPFMEKLHIADVVSDAGLPGTKVIPAASYFLSFLALKLLGTERYAHVGDHAFDQGLGLFSGLTALPKATAMSTYSYSLDEAHLLRLQKAFVRAAMKAGLYGADRVVNLDFHTVPHWGDESVLDEHWVGTRGKRMKGALTLFAQDAGSKLILYTGADIKKDEADDEVLEVLSFWNAVHRKTTPTFIFDSKFTTYANLSELNRQRVKFITLRRRGRRLLEDMERLSPWTRITIPHEKRKYPNPEVYESSVSLKGYEGTVRQVIVRGNGHEQPAYLVSNDFHSPVETIVGTYARRWRVENAISEAVKFFHLNSLSSPILVKVHFDVVMTMMADTLYSMLARHLRGFELCDAPKLYRHFVRGKATVSVKEGRITVSYPRKAHNPILRAVPWHRLPQSLSWLDNAGLSLKFK